jgi:hypothetical protein
MEICKAFYLDLVKFHNDTIFILELKSFSMTLLVDAIGNIRMVNRIIRADILVIDGQNDDGQFRFKKSALSE